MHTLVFLSLRGGRLYICVKMSSSVSIFTFPLQWAYNSQKAGLLKRGFRIPSYALKDKNRVLSVDGPLYLRLEPDSHQCTKQTVSDVNVEFTCDVRYTGSIQPTIQWSPANDHYQPLAYYTDGKLESRLTVSAADPASWPKECQVTFNRQSCNEARAAYTRTAKCPSEDGKYICLSGNSSMCG